MIAPNPHDPPSDEKPCPKPKHPLAVAAERISYWAHEHDRENERIERKLSYPDAIEILSDLEDLFCEATKIDAKDGAFKALAQLTVAKWQAARAKEIEAMRGVY